MQQAREASIYGTIIVGGGAAGLFAASRLVTNEAVLLLERGPECGRKLLLTGGKRCNLTHETDADELLTHYHGSKRFLIGAVHRYDPHAIREHFRQIGISTVSDDEGRVFPSSYKAEDVRDALVADVRKKGYEIRYNSDLALLEATNGEQKLWQLRLADGKTFQARNVLLATGGASYPGTGSDGSVLLLLAKLGIKHEPFAAALTDLRWTAPEEAKSYTSLSGLALRGIELCVLSDAKHKRSKGKQDRYCFIGDLLFTHRGLSGPAALNLSGYVPADGSRFILNLFPGMHQEAVFAKFLEEQERSPRIELLTLLARFMPRSFAETVIDQIDSIIATKRLNEISLKDWRRLAQTLGKLELGSLKKGKLISGMVSRGGIRASEINPQTMELKRYPGLYVCGELIDVDGDTGGYNLQAAFSTAAVAAEHLSI